MPSSKEKHCEERGPPPKDKIILQKSKMRKICALHNQTKDFFLEKTKIKGEDMIQGNLGMNMKLKTRKILTDTIPTLEMFK